MSAIDGRSSGATPFETDEAAAAAGRAPSGPQAAVPVAVRPTGPSRADMLARLGAAPTTLPAGTINTREVARTPQADVEKLVSSMWAQVPELKGVDPRVLEMIFNSRDLACDFKFTPGEKWLEAKFGKLVVGSLGIPTDRPYTAALRSDIYRETSPGGETVEFLDNQTINVVEGEAFREETIHLWSVLTQPDGTKKLAISARRKDPLGEEETPDKILNRYAMDTTRITDYRQDKMFMRFMGRSEKLRAVVGNTPPERLEIMRVSMNKPFEQTVGKLLGNRAHNFYVLNKDTGERISFHWSQMFQHEGPSLVDKVGRVFAPNEIGFFEIDNWREIARTQTFDPTLDTGMRKEFPPGHAEAVAKVAAAPRTWSPAAAGAFEIAKKALDTGATDWAVTNKDTHRVLDALANLAPGDWLAVIDRLSATPDGHGRVMSGGGKSSLVEKLKQRGIEDDATLRGLLEAQVAKNLGARDAAELKALVKALHLEAKKK
jgi:hypothetical protein